MAVSPTVSHRRGCHFADALSPTLLKHLLKVEGGAAEWQSRRRLFGPQYDSRRHAHPLPAGGAHGGGGGGRTGRQSGEKLHPAAQDGPPPSR